MDSLKFCVETLERIKVTSPSKLSYVANMPAKLTNLASHHLSLSAHL